MTAAEIVQSVPLITREALFGNPVRSGGTISPDGKWLGWMAPNDGVMNVFVAPFDKPDEARQMTSAVDRPIPFFSFTRDSASVIYIQDKAGDENFLLYQVNIASGAERALTPFEKTRARVIGGSHTIRDKLLIGLNNRDPQYHDVYLLNLTTGALDLVLQNDSYVNFLADDTLTLRMAVRQNDAGGSDMFEIVDGKVAETPRDSTTLEDSLSTGPAGYTTDGKTLYWIDSRGRDTAALIAEDTATGAKSVIAENGKADIGGTLRHPVSGKVEAFSVNYLKTEWTALNPEIGQALAFLANELEGEFGVQSRCEADDKWLVWHDPLTGPTRSLLYDRSAGTLEEFSRHSAGARRPAAGADAPGRHQVARRPDAGQLPDAAAGQRSRRRRQARPAPCRWCCWSTAARGRATAGASTRMHQLLANRGYAVLQVNFRGSTGFGKAFINAGNHEWGGKMHDDLIDAVDWAVARGHRRQDKVAIMGGSYGGYATLVGLTFTPEVFACGVDIVGPSNLVTLLATIPPYWAPMVKQFNERVGDPRHDRGPAAAQGPLAAAHGRQDQAPAADRPGRQRSARQAGREPTRSSRRCRSTRFPVTYVLFPDEGHGFARPENNIAFNAITEAFLATELGGRAEPSGGEVEKSTAQIKTGAELV